MNAYNKQIVRGLYEAYSRGDIDAIVAALADDFDWTVPGRVPFSGKKKGHAGMREFLAQMVDTVRTEEFEVREFLADGDKVVVLGRERATVRATGRQYDTDFAHVWTLRDGRISHGQVFADTAAGGAAFEP